MKRILSILAIVATLGFGTAKAEVYVTNNLTAYSHLVLSNTPIALQSITFWTTNTTAPTLIKLYDGHLITTNTAYTNYTAARTAVVSTYTTSTGTTNTLTNYVWKTTANAVAAANTTRNPILTLVVPVAAGGPITFPVDDTDPSIVFARFMVVSNDATGVSFSATYKTQ
jgi:hypothetical protein